jgi:F1F0 ATPase subunit 2
MTEIWAGLDPLAVAGAFLAGAALAALYLAALWRSVRGLAGARRPAAALVPGALVRVAVVAGAFALAARGGAAPLLACLAGFVVVRVAVTRRVGAPSWGEGG